VKCIYQLPYSLAHRTLLLSPSDLISVFFQTRQRFHFYPLTDWNGILLGTSTPGEKSKLLG